MEELGLLQGQVMVLGCKEGTIIRMDLVWDKETASIVVMEDLQELSHSLKLDLVVQAVVGLLDRQLAVVLVVVMVGLVDMEWLSLDNVTSITM